MQKSCSLENERWGIDLLFYQLLSAAKTILTPIVLQQKTTTLKRMMVAHLLLKSRLCRIGFIESFKPPLLKVGVRKNIPVCPD
ncbi:hypothetical protein [Sporosarcina saromensis]